MSKHYTIDSRKNGLGSGIMRTFSSSGFEKYSYQGPMSFHRGCIQIEVEATTNGDLETSQSDSPAVIRYLSITIISNSKEGVDHKNSDESWSQILVVLNKMSTCKTWVLFTFCRIKTLH